MQGISEKSFALARNQTPVVSHYGRSLDDNIKEKGNSVGVRGLDSSGS
jgi:hypothetical protein